MKPGIHPEYVETRATEAEIHTETCSSCHPFYTGKQQILDTAGRVERFRRKYEKKDVAPAAKG